jgi:NAD kinase
MSLIRERVAAWSVDLTLGTMHVTSSEPNRDARVVVDKNDVMHMQSVRISIHKSRKKIMKSLAEFTRWNFTCTFDTVA